MNPEETKENKENVYSEDFGKVVDALHNKSELPSLRTYKGDMAEFIKEKNESVISVAVKEKKREQQKEAQLGEVKIQSKKPKSNLKLNMTMVLLSLLLLVGGGVGALFVYSLVTDRSVTEILPDKEIIPYNNTVTLTDFSEGSLQSELEKVSSAQGISIIKVTGADGQPVKKAQDLFELLKITLPPELARSLEGDYALGVVSAAGSSSYFLVMKVDDYGRAFAAMLEWEKTMPGDLALLSADPNPTASTTLPATRRTGNYSWKDVIVKNKDTRSFVNEWNTSKLSYAFLDKNTIAITGQMQAISELNSAYISKSVAR